MKEPCNKEVFVINGKERPLRKHEFTGKELKKLAGIPLDHTLFRNGECEDEVIPNDATICVRVGDVFFSQPCARYGHQQPAGCDANYLKAHKATVHPQPGGWNLIVLPEFILPEGYKPRRVKVLVKLPPQFPVAAPDMFWCSPQVQLASGAAPQATSFQTLLGERWQRFSWHLNPGQWKPGQSTLRTFIQQVQARFDRRN